MVGNSLTHSRHRCGPRLVKKAWGKGEENQKPLTMFAQGDRVVPQAFPILCKEHILQSSAHMLLWLPGL